MQFCPHWTLHLGAFFLLFFFCVGLLWHQDWRWRCWKSCHWVVREDCSQNSWQLCCPSNRRGEKWINLSYSSFKPGAAGAYPARPLVGKGMVHRGQVTSLMRATNHTLAFTPRSPRRKKKHAWTRKLHTEKSPVGVLVQNQNQNPLIQLPQPGL